MAAKDEHLLNLFDKYWFEYDVLSGKSYSSPPSVNPDLQFLKEPKITRLSTLLVRSKSDQFLSSKESSSPFCLSPISVLPSPKLPTVLSGKEIGEIPDNFMNQDEVLIPSEQKLNETSRRRRRRRRRSNSRKGRKGSSSKSLSELEFEELKGFMDLGFVFTEEDKDSRLVSIIPGLQRLGRKVHDEQEKGEEEEEEEEGEKEDKEEIVNDLKISRPYLSEAWAVLDRRKQENPLIDWRIPNSHNEIDMKDHLKFWAHTVASAVR